MLCVTWSHIVVITLGCDVCVCVCERECVCVLCVVCRHLVSYSCHHTGLLMLLNTCYVRCVTVAMKKIQSKRQSYRSFAAVHERPEKSLKSHQRNQTGSNWCASSIRELRCVLFLAHFLVSKCLQRQRLPSAAVMLTTTLS